MTATTDASTALVYSTTTGQEPTGTMAEEVFASALGVDDVEWPAFCFVCSRVVDHFAEHDDLVEAGLAEYDTETGNVYRTSARGPEVVVRGDLAPER